MTEAEKLINENARAIVHLRAQRHNNRLGLMFGAGVSMGLGYPSWDKLVRKIAQHPKVRASQIWARLKKQGPSSVTRSLASITQMAFSQFRIGRIAARNLGPTLTYVEELSIKTEWLKLIHGKLYKGMDRATREQKLDAHPYLKSFLPIIKESPLTVTYNFDDSIELMLSLARTPDEKLRTRGFEMIDSPHLQFRHEQGVIYHPNGCLPAVFEDGTSPDVVFSDDSFQDQLLSATNGKYIHLSHHLTKNTCLLVGFSLDDATLQSMLRQNAVRHPGHIHYTVHYTADPNNRDIEAEQAIFTANFESFGLYTLFLGDDGIRALADLIKMDNASFASLYARFKPKFVYYLIGSVAAGKSTAASNFRNLITYDEWIDERIPDLAKPQASVRNQKVHLMDVWIAEQFRKKNFALDGCVEGVHLVDRAPLDPLTFPGDRQRKAATLLKTVTESGTRKIVPGHIIELTAPVEELQIRNCRKHKVWPPSEFNRLIGAIDEVYGPVERSRVCTSGRSAAAVAKEIARIIFVEPYRPVNIQTELEKHAAELQ